jgi:hypothetical protein
MRDYKQLEQIIKDCLDSYQDGFNRTNPDYEVTFYTTLTNHHIEKDQVKAWVAYLRLEKATKPKEGEGEEERLLIYNQAYKFRDISERTDPNAPWKYDLYFDLLRRLAHGGLEYAELLKRMKMMSEGKMGQPISNIVTPNEPTIIVTDQMPAPLSDSDKEYLEWVKNNHPKA